MLPQLSVTVQVFVTEYVQPDAKTSGPIVPVAIKPEVQLSVTLAVPKAEDMLAAVGLHTTAFAAVSVITGACVSLVNVIICVVVPVLPQLSVTVQLFVTDQVQPEPVSAPTVPVAVNPVLQLSVTLADPKAASISVCVGLQGRVAGGAMVITGATVSLLKVSVWKTGIAVLPQESVTFQVRVIDRVQEPVSAPVEKVATNVCPQLSVTVAVPKAAAIWAEVGLQPSAAAAGTVITGLVVS